ncbi:autotransporter domain-containing protein [Bradyrhizobium sp. Arg314]
MAALGLALAPMTPSLATDWTGAVSSNWFDADNWSAGVPNSSVGAVVDTDTPYATVVDRAGAEADLLYVGNSGTGELTIQSGGTVSNTIGYLGYNAASTGTATVDGAGSSWTNSGDLVVGYLGTGTLTIQNGGKVSNSSGFIGYGSSSTGIVTVDGSSWTNSRNLYVGYFGTGTLMILNGGKVSGTDGHLGTDSGTTGTATVDGMGSSWTNSGYLYVGVSGSGALTIENGGAVSNTIGFLGYYAGSTGTARVDGSSWTNSSNLYVGNSGTGTLTIRNGGTVSNTIGYLGYSAGSTGTATVDGMGSSWTNSRNLYVGVSGSGALTIENGGAVSNTIGFLGYYAGSTGTARVDGSSWTNSSNLYVGNSGTGTLAIQNGGTVSNTGGYIGNISGSTGTVTVDGARSSWTNSRDLLVGVFGTGTLAIQNGGTVSASSMEIASRAGSTGTLNIGAASGQPAAAPGTLNTASVAFGAGTGRIVFNHTASNYIFAPTVSGAGSVTVEAGTTILTGSNSVGNLFLGTANVNAGTLRVDGRFGDTVGNAATVIVNSGGTLSGTGTIAGTVTVNSGGTLAAGHSPGTLTVGSLTLTAGSISNFELNTPGVVGGLDPVTGNDLVKVTGNLTLGGTLNVQGAPAAGYYRLFNYGGALAGSFGTVNAAGFSNADVLTSIPNQVNLSLLNAGQHMQFWDGTDATGNGTVDGGSGAWSTAGTNWTGQPGQAEINGSWIGSVGVFAGAAGGAVTVAGAQSFDTLQFSTNGYVLNGGTLAFNPAAGSAATIQVDNAVSVVIGSALSDGATGNSLTKTGGGTLTLDNANTYTGGTTINAGTLNIGNMGALGTGEVTLTGGGALNSTVTGDLANGVNFVAGSFATVSASTGRTLTLGGRVNMGSGGGATVHFGSATNAGTVVLDPGGGVIHRASSIAIDGGTLRLGRHGSDYTQPAAGTSIASGATLDINGSASVNHLSGAGIVTNDSGAAATLTAINDSASTFSGVIGDGTGSIALAKTGSGALTLSGASTYSGGTTISAGTLQLGNGGTTGSIVGNVVNNGTLAFNRSDALTFGGGISGSGAVRQIGVGKTELAGVSSGFAGTTSVENGILAVNGKLGGTLDVRAGGRLQGIGTVGGTTVSGTIAPGNSIGTLNVAGNVAFNAGSIYEVEANAAGQADRIDATGTATIDGGTVTVLAGAGNYKPQTDYTILSAGGGVSGTFAGVTSNLAFLDPTLGYDAGNVYLRLRRNDITFHGIGLTLNQIATGAGTESLGWNNPVYDAVANLSADQARTAFDQLSGEIHASAKTALIEDSRFLRNAVNDRLRAAFEGVGAASAPVMGYADGEPVLVPATTDRLAVWSQGFGSWGHSDGDGNAARLNRSTGGVFIGADAPVFETWRFGAVAGYSRTTFNVRDCRSSGTSDNYHVGLYGGTQWGSLAFRTAAAYTWHDISTDRTVAFPGFSDSLKGDYNAGTAQVFGELGYGIRAGNFAFEPFANLAYVSLHTDGFTEPGGAAALTSAAANTEATFATLGLRASNSLTLGGIHATAKGTLGWRHAFGDVTPLSTMAFAGGAPFSIAGVPIARDAAVIEAGLDFALTPATMLGVSYNGQFASGVSDQSVRAVFNMKF